MNAILDELLWWLRSPTATDAPRGRPEGGPSKHQRDDGRRWPLRKVS